MCIRDRYSFEVKNSSSVILLFSSMIRLRTVRCDALITRPPPSCGFAEGFGQDCMEHAFQFQRQVVGLHVGVIPQKAHTSAWDLDHNGNLATLGISQWFDSELEPRVDKRHVQDILNILRSRFWLCLDVYKRQIHNIEFVCE